LANNIGRGWGQIRTWISGTNIYEGVKFDKGGSF